MDDQAVLFYSDRHILGVDPCHLCGHHDGLRSLRQVDLGEEGLAVPAEIELLSEEVTEEAFDLFLERGGQRVLAVPFHQFHGLTPFPASGLLHTRARFRVSLARLPPFFPSTLPAASRTISKVVMIPSSFFPSMTKRRW